MRVTLMTVNVLKDNVTRWIFTVEIIRKISAYRLHNLNLKITLHSNENSMIVKSTIERY